MQQGRWETHKCFSLGHVLGQPPAEAGGVATRNRELPAVAVDHRRVRCEPRRRWRPAPGRQGQRPGWSAGRRRERPAEPS